MSICKVKVTKDAMVNSFVLYYKRNELINYYELIIFQYLLIVAIGSTMIISN